MLCFNVGSFNSQTCLTGFNIVCDDTITVPSTSGRYGICGANCANEGYIGPNYGSNLGSNLICSNAGDFITKIDIRADGNQAYGLGITCAQGGSGNFGNFNDGATYSTTSSNGFYEFDSRSGGICDALCPNVGGSVTCYGSQTGGMFRSWSCGTSRIVGFYNLNTGQYNSRTTVSGFMIICDSYTPSK